MFVIYVLKKKLNIFGAKANKVCKKIYFCGCKNYVAEV